MIQYDQKIINQLLDRYERSLLSIGENQRNVHIDLPFNKKTIPKYYDESSAEYEQIHILMEQLEKKGLIKILWKDGKKGHLIQKIRLEIHSLDQAYQYVNRMPKQEMEEKISTIIREMSGLNVVRTAEKHTKEDATEAFSDGAMVFRQFCSFLLDRIQNHQPVKEYIDMENTQDVKKLLTAIRCVEENTQSCYIREFSIRHFHDSKTFEDLESRVAKVFRHFNDTFSDMDTSELLAEYKIYRTPNYVYLKGEIALDIGGEIVEISSLRQGIGISGEDLENIAFRNLSPIKKVITIENLTTFFRWQEDDSLIIYLGGYHNRIRRKLLEMIHRQIPQAAYLHFGDIDAGGFAIYKDLKQKTGIPFRIYRMDLDTLKKYQQYGRRLTASDRARLEKMQKEEELQEVIRYMLTYDVKLEQECVLN